MEHEKCAVQHSEVYSVYVRIRLFYCFVVPGIYEDIHIGFTENPLPDYFSTNLGRFYIDFLHNSC